MNSKISLSKLKRRYDLILKELESRDDAFRNDKYDVYFIPSLFEEEVISSMKKKDFDAYGSGAGGELKEHSNKNGDILPASMSSVGSSSRFCYLSLRNSDLSAFGIKKADSDICFEEKLPIQGVEGGIPPHMDAYYEIDDNFYFFECKCHEQFDKHKLELSNAYFDKNIIVDKIDKKYFLENITKKNKRTGKDTVYRKYDPAAFGLPPNPRFDIKQFLTHIMGIESRIKDEIKKGKTIKEVKLMYFYFIPDAALNDKEIKDIIAALTSEVRIAFDALKKLCDIDIKFELYIQHGKRVETASKANVRREI